MDCQKTINVIVEWLRNAAVTSGHNGFVVGVSGGVDSAVVSTLCAMTSLKVKCLILPIHQRVAETTLGIDHCAELMAKHRNVSFIQMDLSEAYNAMSSVAEACIKAGELPLGNMRSRLRMTMLYLFSNTLRYMVAGTGNKVEDLGVSFATKFGDLGVDLNPIGNLMKTQVYDLAKHLCIIKGIQEAAPTDGLFIDGRTDEDQLGATYVELEEAMEFCEKHNINSFEDYIKRAAVGDVLPIALVNYLQRHLANAHKMSMPPIGPEAIQ